MDYPLTRAFKTCPCCKGPKDRGLIVCWPCYRAQNMRHGIPAKARQEIEASELALKDVAKTALELLS